MEPASPTAGRGSIADPEIRTDVPGHVIPILEREFDDFDTESAKFLRGETEEVQFIGFRLKQGVYGQRQAERQMIRVKLPFGGINPEQMEAFADAVERWVPLQARATSPRARTSSSTTCRSPTPPSSSARSAPSGSPRARAAATRCATSPATRGPASARASCSTRRPTPAPTSATSCATTSAS